MATMTKPAFDMSPRVHLLRQCLVAGTAPWFYQREAARLCAKLELSQHAGDWIHALLEVKTRLTHRPLLGDSLMMLTEAEEQSFVQNLARTSAGKKQRQDFFPAQRSKVSAQRVFESALATKSPTVSNERYAAQAQEQSSKKSRRPVLAQELPRLDRRVPQAFLSRVAGTSLPSGNSSSPSHSPSFRRTVVALDRAAAKSRARAFSKSQSGLRLVISPEAEPASYLSTGWCDRVSLRLRQSNGSTLPHAETSLESAASLLQQWSSPINGARAARELLAHLAGETEPRSAGASTHAQPLRAQSPRASNPNQLEQAASAQVEKRAPRQANVGTEMTRHADLLNEIPEASPRDGRTIATPEIQGLPPLKRPEALPPSPLPGKRENLVRVEEPQAAGDDLGALAGKIKQILDDDARRHGIAVE